MPPRKRFWTRSCENCTRCSPRSCRLHKRARSLTLSPRHISESSFRMTMSLQSPPGRTPSDWRSSRRVLVSADSSSKANWRVAIRYQGGRVPPRWGEFGTCGRASFRIRRRCGSTDRATSKAGDHHNYPNDVPWAPYRTSVERSYIPVVSRSRAMPSGGMQFDLYFVAIGPAPVPVSTRMIPIEMRSTSASARHSASAILLGDLVVEMTRKSEAAYRSSPRTVASSTSFIAA